MCGGAIRIVTCSHVAVRAAQQALSVSDEQDLRHIIELTFSDELKRLVYRQTGVDDAMSSRESDSLMIRRNYLRHQLEELHCQPFSWYLANVAMTSDVVRPSTDAKHFGKLRSASSGLCLGDYDDSQHSIQLVTCHEHLYERQLLTEMTSRGELMRDGRCMEPSGDDTVTLEPCQADMPRQRWWMEDGRLSPVTAPRKCLTDSSSAAAAHLASSRPHVATLHDCTTGAAGQDSVVTQRWTFVNF